MPGGRPRKSSLAAAPTLPAIPRGRANNRPQVPFAHKLVLNQWLLSLFRVKRFEDLAEHLRDERMEGLDENNIHHFHRELAGPLFNLTLLSTDLLLEYDQNIVRHTQRLNERRLTRGEQPIVWKYFQYLTLLFTEIYLDRYFRDPKALLKALNVQTVAYNADKPEADQIAPFDETAEAWPQLNKLAYWSATGSGKTLLMHVNILQYQHYLTRHGRRRELNRILLLTPNEGLSQQHLREFEVAGIPAELFNKDGRGLFASHAVEILEVTRLRDEMGAKTIAIDAFEGNNLVLVDEGHRGASAGEEGVWMRYRNSLCEKGFSFEYSATFGQAVKGNSNLIELYAKSTLFDYSYRYFYGDGFGKDYQILNLDEGTQQNHLELYLLRHPRGLHALQRCRLAGHVASVLPEVPAPRGVGTATGRYHLGRVRRGLRTRDDGLRRDAQPRRRRHARSARSFDNDACACLPRRWGGESLDGPEPRVGPESWLERTANLHDSSADKEARR